MEQNSTISELGNSAGCNSCGAILKFAPGTHSLQCEYCGHENEITTSKDAEPIAELDFHAHLSNESANSQDTQQLSTVKCTGCGAESTLKPNITADGSWRLGVKKDWPVSSIARPR